MLKDIYNETITIFNKLRRDDSITGRDVWHKTVIHNAAWYTDSARSAGGSAVYIGSYITILIPFENNYLPYIEWKKPGMQDGHYTMSLSDYVVKGEVTESITADNIVKTLEKYGEDVCLVKHHNELHNRFGATVQLKIQGV